MKNFAARKNLKSAAPCENSGKTENPESTEAFKETESAKGNENNVTELVFILDRSGSMSGLENDTMGGFNSTIAKQKDQPGSGFVTTVLFDHKVETLYERKPLEQVQKLTTKQYYVRGCTALLDAVGETIKRVNKAQKAAITGRPAHTIFVITTDGMENASKHFTAEEVRKLIEKRKKKNGWEFIFLGANIDAVETAGSIGIDARCAADYEASAEGTKAMFGAIDAALCSVRATGTLDTDWKENIARKD